MPLHAFHRKCFIFFGQLSFHKDFQNWDTFALSEHSPLSLFVLAFFNSLRETPYALLIVKKIFFDQAQTNESSGSLGLIGMLRMVSTLWGMNISLISSTFQRSHYQWVEQPSPSLGSVFGGWWPSKNLEREAIYHAKCSVFSHSQWTTLYPAQRSP